MAGALSLVSDLVGIAGGIAGIGQSNQEAALNQAQIDALKQQNELEAQKFGWTKEQAAAELQRKLQSAQNYWNEMSKYETPTMEKSLEYAGQVLSPQYDTQMKETLESVANANKARGFYGQLPGDLLEQNAAAKVQEAKNAAIGNLATQLYQQGQANDLARKSLGINAFGTYGNIDSGTGTTTPSTTTQNRANIDIAPILGRTTIGIGNNLDNNPDNNPWKLLETSVRNLGTRLVNIKKNPNQTGF